MTPDDITLNISLEEFLSLLNDVSDVPKLRVRLKRSEEQLEALRKMYFELLLKVKSLE